MPPPPATPTWAVLAEIYRVLRPGGQLRFFEHVPAGHPGTSRLQRLADATLWPKLFAGRHTSRDTTTAISDAGFTVGEVHRFNFPATGPSSPAAPHIRGSATRPSEVDPR